MRAVLLSFVTILFGEAGEDEDDDDDGGGGGEEEEEEEEGEEEEEARSMDVTCLHAVVRQGMPEKGKEPLPSRLLPLHTTSSSTTATTTG